MVVTLRADFFDRPLDYPLLGPLVAAGQVSLLPISASELEAAAVHPAAGVGVGVEPELIAELIGEVAQQPGVLPLFEFVLTELFDHRVDDRLTLARYRELGGLRGALSRRADELYSELDAEQREAARQVFLRLVTLGEGTEDTRRRVARSELESLETGRPAVEVVLERFGEAGCSRSTAAPSPTSRRSSWPTKPCCESGRDCATGSTRPATICASTAPSRSSCRRGNRPGATRTTS